MPAYDRTLLFCYAHPDDESYLAAGTMARYASDGRTRVILVTATRGGAATLRPGSPWTRAELPEVRGAELHRAARALGVHRVHLLDHPDGGLAAVDHLRLRRELVQLVRRYRPEVVASFDPHGENLHPDHIAIGRFTADAVAAAADPRWLPEAGPGFVVSRVLWTPPVPVWQMLRHPAARPLAEWPGADVVVDITPWRDRKRAALLAHRSQAAGIQELLLASDDAGLVLSAEVFRIGWGGPAAGGLVCLFQDLAAPAQPAAAAFSIVPQGSRICQPPGESAGSNPAAPRLAAAASRSSA